MPDTNPPNDIHVLIVGAGLTGLILAQGLKQAGIRFTIFEKEVVNRQPTREWSMGMHWSLPMLKGLLPADLYARIPEAYADPCYPDPQAYEKVSICNGQTGELLKNVGAPGMIRVDRNRMRKLCSTDIPIQYGKVAVDLTYHADGNGVTAHFSDGSEATGDIVVGADGAHSVIRTILLGKEAAAARATLATNLLVKVNFADAAKARHVRSINPIVSLLYHPNGTMGFIMIQDVLDEDDPTTWTFIIGAGWEGSIDGYPGNETRLARLKEIGAAFSEPFRSASLWIPEGTPVSRNGSHYWVTVPWENHGGRATLMGDAAHPMTPLRGQGVNNCVADISSFVDALVQLRDKKGLAELVAKYEAEVVPRGAAEVEASVKNAEMVYRWDLIMQSALLTDGVARRTT